MCSLTFELSGRQRQDARPGPVKMYRVPPARAWWPAVGAPLERGVRHQHACTADGVAFALKPFCVQTLATARAVTVLVVSGVWQETLYEAARWASSTVALKSLASLYAAALVVRAALNARKFIRGQPWRAIASPLNSVATFGGAGQRLDTSAFTPALIEAWVRRARTC